MLQGHHPFAYALGELIDNALRATNRNGSQGARITISLVAEAGKGLICVRDNGCGMTKRQLNEWAIMNLSLEDRGITVQEKDAGRGVQASRTDRFLTGDLSYFGVRPLTSTLILATSQVAE